MPKEIPVITRNHYALLIVPTVLLFLFFLKYRSWVTKDLAEERWRTKGIKGLLVCGVVLSSLVVAVQTQLIPPSVVRRFFPRWRVPPPMSKAMKILIVFCLVALVIYPTVKFFRTRKPPAQPKVHRLQLG